MQWTSCLKSRPAAKLRLFCFPYAGAGSAVFRSWPPELPETIEPWAVHLPGREKRLGEPAIPSIHFLAQQALTNMRGALYQSLCFFWPQAWERYSPMSSVACWQRIAWGGPQALILSGCGAPHMPRVRPPVGQLADADLAREVQALGGTTPGVLEDPELRSLFLPVLRADFQAVEGFVPPEPKALECPIVAYGGVRDLDVPREHLQAWQDYTTEPLTVRLFPGDHFFVNSQRVDVTTQLARDCALLGLS